MAVFKPAGLTAHPPPGDVRSRRPSAFEHTLRLIKDREGPRSRLLPVQSLDRDASGILVFARTPAAAIRLGDAFRTRRAGRTYTALVCGTPPGQGAPEENAGDGPGARVIGTVHTLLVESRRGVVEAVPIGSELQTAAAGEKEPWRGVTHYRTLRSGPALSLLRVRAETDYPMQIRAHLASIGCPVAGDRAYGARHNPLGRVALHLGEVSFLHPQTMREVRLHARAPADFAEAVAYDPAATPPAGWDEVADWYAELHAERRSDLHERVVWPRTMRLLDLRPGDRLLDVACGPGDLSSRALLAGAEYTGVDVSPKLIEIARQRFGPPARFEVADAESLAASATLTPGTFHAASCVLALMNIADLEAAARSIAAMLRPGGRAVVVILHPAFRAPKQSSWGWSGEGTAARQHRRVDAYLSEAQVPIVMNPGALAQGAEELTTTTHHRPIGRYVGALAAAGLLIDAVEEWASHRESIPGPRAEEENRARSEIPMFLAVRAVRA